MAKQLNLVKSAELKGASSKEQKRFNSYLQKIKKLKDQIELSRELALEMSRLMHDEVRPVEEKMNNAWKTLIIDLDRSMFADKLTPKQYDKYESIVFEEADSYMATCRVDAEIQAIFDKYSPESFDDIKTQGQEQGKEFLIEMLRNQMGVDIDPEDIEDVTDPFNNPKVFEKLREAQEKHKAHTEDQAEKRAEFEANRPKSDKQIQKEERRKAAESAISKTTKQIYMDLVKNFHPDTEQDEEKRLWKTEIMQKITLAYGEDDYIQLLELQMTLLEDRDNAVEKFDDKQLRYFNDALKQQVDELEMQLNMNSPAMNPMFHGAELFSLNRDQMLRNVNKQVKDFQHNLKAYRNNAEVIKTAKGLKEYVKQYQSDDEMDFDMGMMIEMMRQTK